MSTAWEDGGNWNHVAHQDPTAYPGWDGMNATTNDTVDFNAIQLNANCVMAQAHELAGLGLAANYTGTLTLQAQLTLNGNSLTLIAGGNILQKTGSSNGPIFVSGGTFSWTGGGINSAAGRNGASLFTIEPLASVYFTTPAFTSHYFGDDIDNFGYLSFGNSFPITLLNRPTVTNYSTGQIDIGTGGTTGGLRIADGDPPVTIQNSGLMTMNSVTGLYLIDDPVNNNAGTSKIQIGSGTLEFAKGDPTTGFSVNQSAGLIQMSSGATLRPDQGLRMTGGVTQGIGPGTTTIDGAVENAGGDLEQGDHTAGGIGNLDIKGDFTFTSGAIEVTTTTVNPVTTGLIRVWGPTGVSINPPVTSVVVFFIGNGSPPMDVMRTLRQNSSILPGPCNGNPDHYTASITSLGGTNNNYHLQPNGSFSSGSFADLGLAARVTPMTGTREEPVQGRGKVPPTLNAYWTEDAFLSVYPLFQPDQDFGLLPGNQLSSAALLASEEEVMGQACQPDQLSFAI